MGNHQMMAFMKQPEPLDPSGLFNTSALEEAFRSNITGQLQKTCQGQAHGVSSTPRSQPSQRILVCGRMWGQVQACSTGQDLQAPRGSLSSQFPSLIFIY